MQKHPETNLADQPCPCLNERMYPGGISEVFFNTSWRVSKKKQTCNVKERKMVCEKHGTKKSIK